MRKLRQMGYLSEQEASAFELLVRYRFRHDGGGCRADTAIAHGGAALVPPLTGHPGDPSSRDTAMAIPKRSGEFESGPQH